MYNNNNNVYKYKSKNLIHKINVYSSPVYKGVWFW